MFLMAGGGNLVFVENEGAWNTQADDNLQQNGGKHDCEVVQD